MSGQTNERAFETYAEEILLTRGGWKSGSNAEWDKQRALFPAQVFAFIAETQPTLWADMKALHAAGLETLLITALVKELETKGSLHVLRHGFKFYGKTFRLAYFQPAHGANYEVVKLVSKNRLTVTRQVPCHPADNSTVDMVLSVNGLPVATIELKNPGTGQNWRHAIKQAGRNYEVLGRSLDWRDGAKVGSHRGDNGVPVPNFPPRTRGCAFKNYVFGRRDSIDRAHASDVHILELKVGQRRFGKRFIVDTRGVFQPLRLPVLRHVAEPFNSAGLVAGIRISPHGGLLRRLAEGMAWLSPDPPTW